MAGGRTLDPSECQFAVFRGGRRGSRIASSPAPACCVPPVRDRLGCGIRCTDSGSRRYGCFKPSGIGAPEPATCAPRDCAVLVRDAASQHHIPSTAPVASEHSESRGVSHRLGMFGRRRAVLQMWYWLVNANTSQWLSRPRTFRVGGFPFRGEAFPPAMPTSGSPGPAPESQERGGGLSVGLRPRSNHTTLLTEGRGNFAIAHAHPHSPTPSRSRSVPSHVHRPRCRRLAWHTILWHRRCLNQRLFTVHTRARIARCGRPACAGRHTL